jgi:hypothetical protein
MNMPGIGWGEGRARVLNLKNKSDRIIQLVDESGNTHRVLVGMTKPPLQIKVGVLLLSAAGLTFQVNLIRLFSVSQFYHFAFMIVSIAMLGYGASGTILAISKRLIQSTPNKNLSLLALATSGSILGSYLLINWLPFDSFSIAWDSKQIWILVLHYGALASPFFFSGMVVGSLLAAYPQQSGQLYAVNMLGSALGCLGALLAPSLVDGEGVVTLSCGMAALAAMVFLSDWWKNYSQSAIRSPYWRSKISLFGQLLVVFVLLVFAIWDFGVRAGGQTGAGWLALRLSPYKSLSYALQVPGAELDYQRWNSFSRVDLVRSPSIHSYPGLSYRYLQPLPRADGLTVDGDDLTPIIDPIDDQEFTGFLPAAVVFHLRPGAKSLILEPRGGSDILVARAQGSSSITVVESNQLIVSAAEKVYKDPRLQLSVEAGRSYLRRINEKYDVIIFSLTSSYHPVRSGAYSLAEDYRYTVEAFEEALTHLKPDGILLVTRWLQTPPSESLRTFALAVTAIERTSGDAKAQVVAFRGYNTATLLVKNSPFTFGELHQLREFTGERAYDLIYVPGIRPQETNIYNILPETVYYQAFTDLLNAPSRADYYNSYEFNVRPPTDDRPFFGHFYKWSQTGTILAEMGKTWQPFGGAGYFVVLALLILAVLMATVLILLPAAVLGQARNTAPPSQLYLLYFCLIGFAYMLVEIPLIQRFILFLEHPAYAVTAVIFSLLAFSALGSLCSDRFSVKLALGMLVSLLLAASWLLPWFFRIALGLPLLMRLVITAFLIAPAGFLMGVPFPGGIRKMLKETQRSSLIPWIWAANGSASVVSSVLAALLALSIGFDWVLRIGALFYAGAWLAINLGERQAPVSPPHR